MEHLGIQKLLERFSKKFKDVLFVREEIATVLSSFSPKPISVKEISYKEKVIVLNVSPLLRTSLLLKKEAIKKSLEERGILVTDIR